MVKQRKQIPKGPPDSEETSRPLPSVSTSAVFSFLKDTRGVLTWKIRDFQGCLNIAAKDAKQILAILQMQGYIQQKDDTDEYLTTASGEAVSGSKLPRMKRERVEEALSTITERIEAINRDPRARFGIRKAVAFGDFLSKRPQVQAADVGVMLTRRTPRPVMSTTTKRNGLF
jgi:predicted transcriptional regulator